MSGDYCQQTLIPCESLHGVPPVGGNSQEGGKARFDSLLVNNSTKRAVSTYQQPQNNVKNHKIWSPKQRRAYHRIMSGYKLTQYLRRRLRFMTLTTSNEGRGNDLKADFNTLVKRIRRHYGRFEYIRVRTDEGNGVLHILYRGSYIPRSWLQSQWIDIHKSWNVDIRDTQRYHCSYVINQYMCGQSSFVRYSMTMLWVVKGFVSTWKAFCKWYYDRRLELWDAYLYRYAVSVLQQSLDDYG